MSQATPATKFLTPPRIAERLGCNNKKVLTFIAEGELKATDISLKPGIGKPRWRVDPDDLAAFLAARSNTKPTPPTPTRAKPRRAGRRYF